MHQPILVREMMEGRRRSENRRKAGQLAAAFVILAIGFLLLAPDPHDHGDVGSLGGLLRLLLPGSSQTHDSHHSEDEPQPDANGSCPIHFWQQVVATGLLAIVLLRFALRSLLHIPPLIIVPYVTDLGSFHSRAPPVFP